MPLIYNNNNNINNNRTSRALKYSEPELKSATKQNRRTRALQVFEKIPQKRLKWYGYAMRREEEHIVRQDHDVEIPGKMRVGET